MDYLLIGYLIAFLSYLFASVTILVRWFHPKGPNLNLALMFGFMAIALHSAINIHNLILPTEINFSLPNVISLVSLIIAIVGSFIALRFHVNLLLPLIYSFTAAWQLLMIFLPNIAHSPLNTDQLHINIHITLSIFSYCILVIATLYTFQVSYINLKLKTKNLSAVNHLPPLMQVESQLFIILKIGTACLIASLLSGFIFLDDLFSTARAHKTLLSLLALAIYITIIIGHRFKGWRGHRVLFLCIAATTLLTLSYFGSRFVKEFIL